MFNCGFEHCSIILSPVGLLVYNLLLLPQVFNLDSSVNGTTYRSSTVKFWYLMPTWRVKSCFYPKKWFRQCFCWWEFCILYLANSVFVMNMLLLYSMVMSPNKPKLAQTTLRPKKIKLSWQTDFPRAKVKCMLLLKWGEIPNTKML